MLYRGFHHFSRAYSKGLAVDPVSYFADPANQDLAVVKPLRKPISRLDLSRFPNGLSTPSPRALTMTEALFVLHATEHIIHLCPPQIWLPTLYTFRRYWPERCWN
jgi:hypothetical protein